ncbi:MAG: hypothetical protein NC936_03200 [Candidatus Omnitrophica bacterium]|nr:hypothetical protein [Candidatus Omnitrophota bacterium]
MFLRRKGQSTLEYAALVACIVAAIIIMQRYFNRAAQGRWKSAADQLGEQFDYGKTEESYEYSSRSHNREVMDGGTYQVDSQSNYDKRGSVYKVAK